MNTPEEKNWKIPGNRILGFGLTVALGGLLSCGSALAQSMQGSITGIATDPTGALVPKVTITATNERTGFTRTTLTNENGLYEFPSLDPSDYTIKAEASGFKTY